MNLRGLTLLTILLVFLWTGSAHAHSLPLFILPLIGAFLFFPLAVFSSLVGWLAKGLYYSDRTGQRSLSMIRWSDALKEAGLLYGCFVLASFVLDLGVELIEEWSLWWNFFRGLSIILAVTTVLSPLLTMFLHRRFLKSMEEDKGPEAFHTDKPWPVILLGLISPLIFSSLMYVLVASRM